MLKLGVIIVDFLMLYIFPSKGRFMTGSERHVYAREKFMKTEDFSEFDARRKFEEEQKERKKLKR